MCFIRVQMNTCNILHKTKACCKKDHSDDFFQLDRGNERVNRSYLKYKYHWYVLFIFILPYVQDYTSSLSYF